MTTLKYFFQALFILALASATAQDVKADACTDSVCNIICDKAEGRIAKAACKEGCPKINSTILTACQSDAPCTAICDKFKSGNALCNTACGKVGSDKIKDACKKCTTSSRY